MKIWLNKSIASLLIIATLFAVMSPVLLVPRKAQAFLGFGDVVYDPANTFQNTISAAGSAIRTGLMSSMNIKVFALDTIAYAIAKQILRAIVADTINWINSGFDGNPAFLSDPGGFFLGIGDELLGKFLESNELTNFLCSPFSIDVRIAIAFRYRPFAKRVPSCTLTQVIQNSKGAIAGANINGFTAGDFKQGGWPAFVSMTTEPQNNQYGAFVEADDELSIRIGNKTILKQQDLFQGKGFMSWQSCKDVPVQNDSNIVGVTDNDPTAYLNPDNATPSYLNPSTTKTGFSDAAHPPSSNTIPTAQHCETQTPGSVIEDQLATSLGSPVRELELASQINQIVSALFSQLIKQVLVGGLRSVSGRGGSDPDAYLTKLQGEKTLNNQQITTARDNILQSIDRYIDQATKYRDFKQSSFNYALGTKQSLDGVKACFSNKLLVAQTPPLTQYQITFAQSQITTADNLISTRVASTSAQLYAQLATADTAVSDLTKMKTDINAAQTLNDLLTPSQKFNDMVNGGNMIDEAADADAQAQYDTVKADMDTVRQTATRLQQSCSLFPNSTVTPYQ